MGDYIPAAGDALQLAVQVAFFLAVAFKTVQEARDIRRKQLEIKRQRQQLGEDQNT
jgi:hypothetical protein